jgi:hypothetical protein
MTSDAGSAITRYEFLHGLLRGSHLALYANCLVHRGETQLETFPLATVSAVRVAFERNPRKLGWGAGLIVIAFVLLAIAGPLGGLANYGASEMSASSQGVARALLALFRLIEALAAALPVLALGAALGGVALIVLGWHGETTLKVTLSGAERAYAVRGRDTLLLDFAEAVCERLMLLKR